MFHLLDEVKDFGNEVSGDLGLGCSATLCHRGTEHSFSPPLLCSGT